MTSAFVSFAQNFEDVMLWRALRHVEHGFYIDVGAYSPREHSVTQAFHERGWRGINIEPYPEYHRQFVITRPKDINLSVAVGDRTADLTMNFVTNSGLSTLNDTEAKRRIQEGFTVLRDTVHVETLEAICRSYLPKDQPVHFLKVDVEGFEREVLLGNDWSVYRPWIVVVEATQPLTSVPSHHEWEGILTDARYLPIYHDGLNRFYLAREHDDLSPAFDSPPNFFDQFIRSSEVEAWERATRAEGELTTIRGSRSWRMTRPLRSFATSMRVLRAGMVLSGVRAGMKIRKRSAGVVWRLSRFVRTRPALRRLFAMTRNLPGFGATYRWLNRLSRTREVQRYAATDLSPRATRIYTDLAASEDRGESE